MLSREVEAGRRGKREAAFLRVRVIEGELGEAVQERYVRGASLVLLL